MFGRSKTISKKGKASNKAKLSNPASRKSKQTVTGTVKKLSGASSKKSSPGKVKKSSLKKSTPKKRSVASVKSPKSKNQSQKKALTKTTGSKKSTSASSKKTASSTLAKKSPTKTSVRKKSSVGSLGRKSSVKKKTSTKKAVLSNTTAARKKTQATKSTPLEKAKRPKAKKASNVKKIQRVKKSTSKKPTVKKSLLKASVKPAVKRASVQKRTTGGHAPLVRPPFEAYNGIRPYLFTSYAHHDMKTVFSIIKKLHKKRYRIWYDEGIEPGNEWPEIVGKAIIGCTQFLVLMSPHAAVSRNVRNEINLAFNENKNILVVFLKKTNLTEGMKLQIGTVQFINKYELSEREFLEKLNKVLDSNLKN